MPSRRTPRRPRRRAPTPRRTTRNANSGVLTQEVIEQASQAALERGGSVSDPMFAAYGDQAESHMDRSVRELMRALEVGTYTAAPGSLQQGAPLQVEDLQTFDYALETRIEPIHVLGRFEPVDFVQPEVVIPAPGTDAWADYTRRSTPGGRVRSEEVVEMSEIIRGFRKDSK